MGLTFSNHPLYTFGEGKTQKAPWSSLLWLDFSIYGQNIQYLRFPNRSFFVNFLLSSRKPRDSFNIVIKIHYKLVKDILLDSSWFLLLVLTLRQKLPRGSRPFPPWTPPTGQAPYPLTCVVGRRPIKRRKTCNSGVSCIVGSSVFISWLFSRLSVPISNLAPKWRDRNRLQKGVLVRGLSKLQSIQN